MATPAQFTANQANARHSTGPQTREGKAASSHNAVKHGLSSPFLVLAHEDQDEFNELVECLTAEHQPANPHQAFLVDQLVIAHWQLARAQRLQTKAFDQLASGAFDIADTDARIVGQMFKSNPNVLTTLQRYAAQAERSYYKAYRELKLAKQIQAGANLVSQIDGRSSRNVMTAPMPNHPLYASQYGNPPKPPAPVKPAAKSPVNVPAQPSLRSQMPDNLALCL